MAGCSWPAQPELSLGQQEQLIAKQELEEKQPAGPTTAPGGKESKAIVL